MPVVGEIRDRLTSFADFYAQLGKFATKQCFGKELAAAFVNSLWQEQISKLVRSLIKISSIQALLYAYQGRRLGAAVNAKGKLRPSHKRSSIFSLLAGI